MPKQPRTAQDSSLTPNLITVPLDQLYPNPWQTRQGALSIEQLSSLVESIRQHGLLQAPTARPRREGGYELAFGHRRLTAFRSLGRDQMPVRVLDLTDRQMADLAAQENAERADLSAIEKAEAIRHRCDTFGISQAEAGTPFGLSQSAVSHLLRLLDLPDSIRALIHAGQLAERHARRLVPIARVDPKAATTLAQDWAKETDLNEWEAQAKITGWYNSHLRPFNNLPFAATWPVAVTFEGTPAPTCNTCPHFETIRAGAYCTRPACADAKTAAYAEREVARLSKTHKIKPAKPGEEVVILLDYKIGDTGQAAKLVKKPTPDLRLLVAERQSWRMDQTLGSPYVALGTVDSGRAEKFHQTQDKAKAKTQNAQRKLNEAAAAADAEADAKTAEWDRLQDRAAEILAGGLPTAPGLLAFLWTALRLGPRDGIKPANIRAELTSQYLQTIWDDSAYEDRVTIQEATSQAAKLLKIKLPKGWDAKD